MMNEVTLLPTLPDVLIEEILLKLPVKYVLRSKCVCKSWLSLISNPQFAKCHFDASVAPTNKILNLTNDEEFKSIDTDAAFDDNNSKEVVFNIPLPSLSCKFMAGSCRGFILLTTDDVFYTTFIDFLIWNPSTGFVKQIMPFDCDPNTSLPLCGIGYDSSTDDYMVVAVTLLQHHTVVKYFSLRTNSWRFSMCPIPYDSADFRRGEFLNGALHWFVYNNRYCLIIAFDVRKKRLSEILLPHDATSHRKIYGMSVISECMCICVKNYTKLEIWTMKKYKVQSSWTKSFVLSTFGYSSVSIHPMCFMKNGEILGTDGVEILARFNDKGELYEYRRHKQQGDRFGFGLKYWCMYRESLLSLPAVFEKPSEDVQTIYLKCKAKT